MWLFIHFRLRPRISLASIPIRAIPGFCLFELFMPDLPDFSRFIVKHESYQIHAVPSPAVQPFFVHEFYESVALWSVHFVSSSLSGSRSSMYAHLVTKLFSQPHVQSLYVGFLLPGILNSTRHLLFPFGFSLASCHTELMRHCAPCINIYAILHTKASNSSSVISAFIFPYFSK